MASLKGSRIVFQWHQFSRLDFFVYVSFTHTIHVWYIYSTYIYHRIQPNVGKYTSPMDAMGQRNLNFE